MIRILILNTLICLSSAIGQASHINRRVVSFSKLFEVLLSDERSSFNERSIGRGGSYYSINSFLLIDSVEFKFDRKLDDVWDRRFTSGGEKLYVKKTIDFLSCTFSDVYWLLMRDMVFEEAFLFFYSSKIKMIFKDCVFRGPFIIGNASQIDFIEFDNCTFERGFSVIEGSTIEQHAKFVNCRFYYNESFITNHRVNKDQYLIGALKEIPPLFEMANAGQPFDLTIQGCEFRKPDQEDPKAPFYINLSHGTFKSLEMDQTRAMVPIDLSFSSVENQLKFHETSISRIVADAVTFNTLNTKLDWRIFRGHKIAIGGDKGKFWNGPEILEANSRYYFENLIGIYSLFYQTYKSQGNRISANSCYVEWKDIETKFLFSQISSDYNSINSFNWFMNVFLSTFCDYGTNPFKSLVWSLGVVIAFTWIFFFMMLYHHTELYRNVQLIALRYSRYFTHDLSLLEIASVGNSDADSNHGLDVTNDYVREYKAKLPWIFRGLLSRFSGFQLANFFHFNHSWMHKWLGRWSQAKGFTKVVVRLIVVFLALIAIFGAFLIRLFEAFMISLSSFTTLGYGELPAGRTFSYLAIIEGSIGWFLLSIFSVALISQIIQ